MFILWLIRILVVLAIITVIRSSIKRVGKEEYKAEMYRRVRSIPILGKLIVLAWRLVKKVALAMWETVIWITKLPVVRTLIAIPVKFFKKLAGLWQKLLIWSETD